MERNEVERWLEQHPAQVHGVPHEVVEGCEHAVRRHAAEDAWAAARSYVEGRMEQWEHEWGFPASEAGVAKEVCRKLAGELAKQEPGVDDSAGARLAGEDVLGVLEPEARQEVLTWVCELAREVEHRIWREIVRFTRDEGQKLLDDRELSEDMRWGALRSYTQQAAHVAQLVLRDYDQQSRRDQPGRNQP